MITEQALSKARQDLYNITSNLSMQDYIRTNYRNGKRISKKHIPYSLSSDTEQAKEYYNIVCGATPEDITPEQEEQIKAFLLSCRLNRTELLVSQ